MEELNEQTIGCPYCGELIDVLIDSTDVDQQYIEDCQVCCRPIVFKIYEDMDGGIIVNVFSENEAY
ncbi:hypothetical protein CS022_01750 [Veronia nyctiphanis]|uniref:CPXCG motif-containing cysteine-rich protein n=1 Tax=Veronia nyctiphanis TaxID=1278244 RepID=A0A4Q0YUE8_9GAMM|nr:CPXCG motif-containing cysteine-rich protein [Veronia nyctiphanis]RXJ74932.1 hypothetical protein CS022_01750 [Veronia nyctiphanis]